MRYKKSLVDYGLIIDKRLGQGKSNKIYVLKPELWDSQKSQNRTSSSPKIAPLEVPNKDANDTYINETNLNNVNRTMTEHFCVFNDVNLQNFIIGSKLYRVDLEDWIEGCLEGDFGKFIAFILTYNPIFSDWKIKLARKLLKYIYDFFYIDKNKSWIEINKEFQSMLKRRNLHPEIFNEEKINDLLR